MLIVLSIFDGIDYIKLGIIYVETYLNLTNFVANSILKYLYNIDIT